MPHDRLGCSSISFRHLRLEQALGWIRELRFAEIDLGALPGVCDHVPERLTPAAVKSVAAAVRQSRLKVRSVNGDVGDLNRPLDAGDRAARERHLEMLLSLASTVGARALVLPCGALDHQPVHTVDTDLDRVAVELRRAADRAARHGVRIWTESLHHHRLCHDIDRAQRLFDRLHDSDVDIVMDFSHIVASGGSPEEFVDRFGPRIAHVHIRDAVPGNINISVGRGAVDFALGFKALAKAGYSGHFSLELETRDITDDERPLATADAADYISTLI